MYIVVVGHSEFACELAKLILKESENKVVLVVKKKEEAIRLTEELGLNVVNADATKPDVLDELGLEKCDIFIAASDLEKDNVLSSMYAKDAGAKKIFVKIDNVDAEPMLKKLGFVPINAEHFAANAVELMISRPAVGELVNIGTGEFDMIEVSGDETKFLGKEICEAKGKNFTAIATCADGKYNFSKDGKISAKDKLLLIVKAGKEVEAEKELGSSLKKRLGF